MLDRQFAIARQISAAGLVPVLELASEAEAGYDVEEIMQRRGGRPAMGVECATEPAIYDSPLRSPKVADEIATARCRLVASQA